MAEVTNAVAKGDLSKKILKRINLKAYLKYINVEMRFYKMDLVTLVLNELLLLSALILTCYWKNLLYVLQYSGLYAILTKHRFYCLLSTEKNFYRKCELALLIIEEY